MANKIGNTGLYFDDLNKIRVIDPDIAHNTKELKNECKDFIEKISEFRKIVDGLINIIETLGKSVEDEKMRAIGARNMLKSVEKQRESEQQQLQALILEKTMELERLRIQYQSLQKTEQEQQETIEQLVLHR